MKKLYLLFLLTTSAWSQSTAGPFTISSGSSPCAQISVSGQSAVGIAVTGTFSATLQPKVAIQGQASTNIQVTPSTSTTAQGTITAVGNYTASVGGFDLFQVCVSSYVSGTATIYLNSVRTTASNGGSGGGGSSFVSPLTTKGDIFTFTSVNARVGVGSNGQCLTAQSGQATGLLWASCGGTSFPINLPDGTVTTPQLSSASNPTDGFYIAAGLPNWIFEVAGTQVFAFRGSVSGSVRAIALGSSASLCFANGNILDGNASSNCDGYLHRVAANEIGFGSTGGSNDGTITTGTFLPTVAVSLPSGNVNSPSMFFTANSASGFYYDAPTQTGNWGDGAGSGSALFSWSTTTNASPGVATFMLVAPAASLLGFGNGVSCIACIEDFGTGIIAPVSGSGGAGNIGAFEAAQYLTATTCSATGTSANPSLVNCSTANAGVFSCATAASTGTCVISSTAVTTSSTILVNPSSAEGTQISVTCNTAPTLVPTILLKSKTTGSFTINMPTITVNPECFTFAVIN